MFAAQGSVQNLFFCQIFQRELSGQCREPLVDVWCVMQ